MPGTRTQLVKLYARRIVSQNIAKTLRELATPSRLRLHGGRLMRGDDRALSNWYKPSNSRDDEAKFCADALSCPVEDVLAAFDELDADTELLDGLREHYQAVRPGLGFDVGHFRMWYALVRIKRPATVLETGVHDGLSSVMLLRALERNGAGRLHSVDLPSTDLPAGPSGPGWLVDEHLRGRWTLHLGDSRALLPKVAAQIAPIDLFIHDSDHSRAFQDFEFRTVRPLLAPDGLLLSDDADADGLMDDLAEEWRAMARHVQVTADTWRRVGLIAQADRLA